MTQLKAAPLGIALGFLGVLVANAADLPPPVAYPIYMPPPAFTWAGPYLGATLGYANGFHGFDDLAGAFLGYPGLSSDQSKGLAAGGTGFNLQAGSLVYGLEADLSWLNNKATYVDPNGAINNFYPSETNQLKDQPWDRPDVGFWPQRDRWQYSNSTSASGGEAEVGRAAELLPRSNDPKCDVVVCDPKSGAVRLIYSWHQARIFGTPRQSNLPGL